MNVRKMGVRVTQRPMRVRVSMRLLAVPGKVVLVLMMRVMPVRMLMVERLVSMLVKVLLGEMQPDPEPHQCTRQQQGRGKRLAEQWNREGRPEKWREREVRTGAGGAELA